MKFLDTNITIDNFVSSLKKTEENLPELIYNWSTLDEELQESYMEDLCWMLRKAAEYIELNAPPYDTEIDISACIDPK